LYVRELRVGQQDITPFTTWSPVALLQPEFPSRKSQPRITPDGRETTRWRLTGSMAERQVDMQGRHRYMPTGWVIHWRRTSILTLAAVTSLSQCGWDLGRFQRISSPGRRISINTGEIRETSYLFQRMAVLLQRFNAVFLHDSLPAADWLTARTDDRTHLRIAQSILGTLRNGVPGVQINNNNTIGY